LLQDLAELVAAGEAEHAPHLWALVAELIRSRLDPADAAVVAAWFDRLAEGEPPESVFPGVKRGRPRGATRGRVPDDFDVAWLVRDAINSGMRPPEAYRAVAEGCGLAPGSVRNIYGRLKDELG
jgi:hypothetical protein